MAYALTHDLRAPVRQIEAFVNLLLEKCEGLDAEGQKYADYIQAAAGSIRGQLDALTRYARETEAPAPGAMMTIELGLLVDGLVVEMDGAIRAAGAQVHVGVLPEVFGAPAGVRTVFRELIENSLKFAGDAACVRIDARTEVDVCIVSVSDNGPGLPAEHREKALQLFRRCQAGASGTGTGLAIVQGILGYHDGPGSVGASPEGGFRFEFPLRTAGR
ncbi:MAG: hypothetical protein HKN12_07900 [Gemmatimonadetes bacterium]|nr:hypothetical protein [Gemmatimonadota bacterium]